MTLRFTLLFAALVAAALSCGSPSESDGLSSAEAALGADDEVASITPTFQRASAAAPSFADQLLERRRPLAHLRVQETSALFRPLEHLSFGVPFARGALEDPADLRVWWARDGEALPAQARALSRWPDGSLRWALVDTQVELAARAKPLLVVGLADDIAPDPVPWSLDEARDGTISLNDGRTTWKVLERAPHGDAVAGLRALLTDRLGHEYASRVDGQLTWLEHGPLRATALVTGTHRALSEEGLDIGFHDFRVWVHFLANHALARVEWSLENGPLENPPGRLAFRSYELLLDAPAKRPRIQLASRVVEAGQSVQVAQTRGGTLRKVGGVQLSPGPPGDLWIGLIDDRAERPSDVWVHRVESAQNHPAAFAHAPGEPLRIELLSAAGGEEFWLDDATRKTFRLNLARDVGPRGRTLVAAAQNPAHVALNPFEVRLTRAWGDDGLFVVPSAAELRASLSAPRDAPTGWADWGERLAKNTHQTGSPRNRPSVFLEAMQTGRADLFRWNRSRAWHAMDLRPYHIRGFRASEHPDANLYEGTPHTNESADKRLGRSEMKARFLEYKQGLPEKGHGYNGFDAEHMALDDVYELYLLTGSWPALDALRSAGEAMLTWWEVREGGKSYSSRTFGWTLRALMQVFRATGEPRYLKAAQRMVHREDARRGKGAVKWFVKQKPDKRHIADKEWDSPWMVSFALRALAAYHFETEDPVVPPMLADLSQFCLSAQRDGVFMPDIPIDGSPIPLKQEDALGTSLWVPGGLAAAAFALGDHKAVDKVLTTYAKLHDHQDRPTALGGKSWAWWQPYRVSLRQRLGSTEPQRIVEELARLKAERIAKREAKAADASTDSQP